MNSHLLRVGLSCLFLALAGGVATAEGPADKAPEVPVARPVVREVSDHEFGGERGAGPQRLLQPWPDPCPGADDASADGDPCRVHQDREIHQV